MRSALVFLVVGVTALLSGCAEPLQRSLRFNPDVLSTHGRVGVAMTPVPKPNTEFPGAGCLLCMATAEAAHSTLSSYVQSLPTDDLSRLKEDFAEALRKKGVDAIVISEPLVVDALAENSAKGANIARRDFTPLKVKYKIDKLVVFSIGKHGISRSYSSYVPTGDPRGVLRATGYIVNLNDNTYDWYKTVVVSRAGERNWDEPPKFPAITNVYFEAIERGKDSFMEPLGQ
ncbi:MAG: hypothetical protein QOD26_4238 [Betaproteobacteria bacterium]|jgi:hypothetical protein|nr:hypothetical protein [Betaproteobacteria bacterium]